MGTIGLTSAASQGHQEVSQGLRSKGAIGILPAASPKLSPIMATTASPMQDAGVTIDHNGFGLGLPAVVPAGAASFAVLDMPPHVGPSPATMMDMLNAADASSRFAD